MQDLLIIISVTLVTSFLMEFIFLKYKHNNIFDNINSLLTSVENITHTVNSMKPNSNLNTLEVIEKYSKIAVNAAEQLYQTNKLPKEERKEHAETIVYHVLQSLDISVTEQVKTLVNGAIEAEVLALKKIINK